jgi:hypothetical protein
MIKQPKQEWTALCRDCRFTGNKQSDQTSAQQEMKNHLKTHPNHKVRVFVTGEKAVALPSSLSHDKGNYHNLPVKGNT